MSTSSPTALDRARAKAYRRLLPLLFLCYVIAYVDRTNVSIAALTMTKDLPGFNNAVFGFGAGVFFLGYFLLEIPGTLIVEKWSARKWISRIMISWGIMAALTALVKTPTQFYSIRFLLGLAEAGFFPGVIVYLTHWFPSRDRARALAYFFVATPIAQIVSPKLSNLLLKIGVDGNPMLLGLKGWQWVYIAWGIPAVVLGIMVLLLLTDRPGQANWLEADEREALENELKREKAQHHASRHMKLTEALRHPKVLLLAAAYFFIVTGNYGVEFFLPKILERWYSLKLDALTWLVILPPIGSLIGQILVGWNSDRTKERRLHAVIPIYLGALALALTPWSKGQLWLTIALFIGAMTGLKAYLPAFWSLPSLFLTEAAAAGCIGLINSVGNLGGFVGPYVLGYVEKLTGSFQGGIYFLCASMTVSATIILLLGLGRRDIQKPGTPVFDPLEEALAEPV
ncbi:MFS transporter [Singulisphaera acidiphila]|uniref:Sugar phosphate permease n=1 Tax=Singulisphaera acidiphila (strain ATCC BAA-1392 / DSM 18658 / VKM B-2454 / MOB10) TaxID=886293 RepID=L0D6T3_SINAD|nr:MFS transporter [Singulisphaera acidiphila]AGA24580.1 sugar phosphate permease [Singulisphaera acidiphila DSM 18658]